MDMMEIMYLISSLLTTLQEQYGSVGSALGYFILFSPLVSLVIEMLLLVSKHTKGEKDDQLFGKVKYYWETYLIPLLALIPRVNIPVASWARLVITLSQKILDAYRAAKQKLIA